ncbi:MAG: hypothetical protein Q9217_001106 [Psora testacea]
MASTASIKPAISNDESLDGAVSLEAEERLRLKVDFRLCTIAGLLCSLNILDSSIISSASVTSMLKDLGLEGNRYSVSILIFTMASVCFQLPATLAVRFLGPRTFFSSFALGFGLITICTAFIHTWQQMIVLRALLGICTSGIYPGLAFLISSWYRREELQLRFAFLQVAQVVVLATGGIVNFGLNQLGGQHGLKGWQWMYVVQGLITCLIAIATYWWIVDFPENATKSFFFLDETETRIAVARIQRDRRDVIPTPFSWPETLKHFLDPKVYGFAAMFFLLNLVSTALGYFLPIILQNGMGFSENKSILLSAPPNYYAVIPVLLSSRIGDKYRIRGPVITFNSLCLIAGFCMLGFSDQVTARYVGTYLATGAYVSNWAALNSYQACNITGQWKRAVTAAAVTACNGLGGVAGSFIVRPNEAPRYPTAVWVSIGSHIMIIGIVATFSMYFFTANQRQRKGKNIIEHTDGFRYTY